MNQCTLQVSKTAPWRSIEEECRRHYRGSLARWKGQGCGSHYFRSEARRAPGEEVGVREGHRKARGQGAQGCRYGSPARQVLQGLRRLRRPDEALLALQRRLLLQRRVSDAGLAAGRSQDRVQVDPGRAQSMTLKIGLASIPNTICMYYVCYTFSLIFTTSNIQRTHQVNQKMEKVCPTCPQSTNCL